MKGIYAILDVGGVVEPEDVSTKLQALLASGIGWIQLRAKSLSDAAFLSWAKIVREETRRASAKLIINDRADIATLVDADGVHVGQEDLAPAEIRRWRPRPFIVGLSCHNLDQVRQVIAQSSRPVDYVGFGPVFATTTKRNPDPVVGLASLRDAVRLASPTPVVAIGGISVDDVPAIHETGASAAAMVSGLVGSTSARPGDVLLRAQQALALWTQAEKRQA